MAKSVIKGIDRVLKRFKRFGEEGEKVIAATTEEVARNIMLDARVNAPKNNGKLAQSINYQPSENKLNYTIDVSSPYGAYVEFGTGRKVSVPTELKDVASKFRGGNNGTFEEGLQAIRDWCRNKGIDEKAAYPIFISILERGITPQPYLYPAFVKGRKNYLKFLKQDINSLIKKYE